jgi:4-hydroxy-3-polyprenylbenzoate decarboxylase
MMFNNIKGYNSQSSRCRQIFGGVLNSYRRIALMMGLPADTHPRELVKLGRTILQGSIPPRIVKTGPCKDNILTGNDINLFIFLPHWNRIDGGAHLSYGGVVTKDQTSGSNAASIAAWSATATRSRSAVRRSNGQHHRMAAEGRRLGNADRGRDRLGAELGLLRRIAGAEGHLRIRRDGRDPRRAGRSGQMRDRRSLRAGLGRDRDRGLSRARPVDLHDRRPYAVHHTAATNAETEIRDGDHPPQQPILRTIRAAGQPENAVCSSIMRAATAWNVLDRAGVPGITDVWCPPVQAGVNALVRMKQSYRGQAKQVANALWGSSAAHVRYKHVTVVDDDIDIHDYAAVDWAIAYRVNAGEDDIVIMPATFGAGLDPSVRAATAMPICLAGRTGVDRCHQHGLRPDSDLGGPVSDGLA